MIFDFVFSVFTHFEVFFFRWSEFKKKKKSASSPTPLSASARHHHRRPPRTNTHPHHLCFLQVFAGYCSPPATDLRLTQQRTDATPLTPAHQPPRTSLPFLFFFSSLRTIPDPPSPVSLRPHCFILSPPSPPSNLHPPSSTNLRTTPPLLFSSSTHAGTPASSNRVPPALRPTANHQPAHHHHHSFRLDSHHSPSSPVFLSHVVSFICFF